jgi:5'-nucleotidase
MDIPASATPQTEWRMAKISRQRYYQTIPMRQRHVDNPQGFGYRIHINLETLEPESDIYVFAVEKLISVVPMTIDLTAPIELQQASQFFYGT